jgi:outer membrane protein OmpA-like peptidoglycan-associated protein
MSRYGKCQNFSGCLLAYRGEETEVEEDQPFICAECGKPLTEVGSPSTMWLRYVYIVVGVAVVGGGLVFAIPSLRNKVFKPKKADTTEVQPGTSSTQTETPTTTTENPSTTTTTTTSPTTETPPVDNTPVAEPPKYVTSPERINMDLTTQENKSVKTEVLDRVDQMPVSQGDKDKLYAAVERAKSMGKILTIPFGSGKTELTAADLSALKTELEKPEITALRDNTLAVFVILGYADPKGDKAKNLVISRNRADAVQKSMRDTLGVKNLMYTMGMGGSKLVDAQNLEKNRIVEIWAVLP